MKYRQWVRFCIARSNFYRGIWENDEFWQEWLTRNSDLEVDVTKFIKTHPNWKQKYHVLKIREDGQTRTLKRGVAKAKTIQNQIYYFTLNGELCEYLPFKGYMCYQSGIQDITWTANNLGKINTAVLGIDNKLNIYTRGDVHLSELSNIKSVSIDRYHSQLYYAYIDTTITGMFLKYDDNYANDLGKVKKVVCRGNIVYYINSNDELYVQKYRSPHTTFIVGQEPFIYKLFDQVRDITEEFVLLENGSLYLYGHFKRPIVTSNVKSVIPDSTFFILNDNKISFYSINPITKIPLTHLLNVPETMTITWIKWIGDKLVYLCY